MTITLSVGDTVTRMLGGSLPMKLKITQIKDGLIHCGPWTFCPKTGMEIDEELGWNANHSGSYLAELQPLNK